MSKYKTLAKHGEAAEGKWVWELSNAIVRQAFEDYMTALFIIEDKRCTPHDMSTNYAYQMLNQCHRFFRSQWCAALTTVDCVEASEKIASCIKPFLEQLRVVRPINRRHPGEFICPNCGSTVYVKHAHEKNGILKASCKSCILHTIYRIPNEELNQHDNKVETVRVMRNESGKNAKSISN